MQCPPSILIVDDDTSIRNFLKLILQKAKYNVYTASNGMEGWEILQAQKANIKVVLLDRVMPKMGGLELLKLIRKDLELKDLQVILQTGLSDEADVAIGTTAGANRYITKPLSKHVVLAMVKSCLKDHDHLSNVKYLADLSDEFKTKMLSIFSHGIKTPLNGILGFTQFILEENKNLDSITLDYLKIIQQSGERINNFVENALLLISLKAGKVDIDKCRYQIPVHSVLEGIIDEYKQDAQKKQVTIEFSRCGEGEQNWRWELIEKVFRTVLDNALKFSPEHSQINIKSSIVDQKEWVIEIEDQGKGLPADAEDRIFQLFEVQNVMNLTEGFGVSLILSKQVLELFNGQISGENKEEGGAVFKIRLPLSPS